MKYKISLHKSDEGYSVSTPGLPGCWSQGATETEALDNIKDAIREHLAVGTVDAAQATCSPGRSPLRRTSDRYCGTNAN